MSNLQIFKFTAENLRDNAAAELLDRLTESKVDVLGSRRNPVFDSMYELLIACNEARAEEVRDMIWERNYGAYCCLRELTEDEVEEIV